MEFQNRLYELRKKAGLSQEGLADLLGVTRQAVQKWEAGSSRPDMDNLAALARYFNVTLDYLVTGREPEPYAQEVPTTIINHNYYPRWHYEYKSQRTLFGLPLVHIRLGDRGFGVAKGIFAVGNVAVGLFALGGISLGLFSLGGVSLGLLLALGGLLGGGRGALGGGRLVVHVGVDGLDGVHLVVLGQIFKHDGQLLVGQGLHMVLGGMTVLGQNVHDLLGRELFGPPLEILGNLVNGIFYHHMGSHLVS